MPKFSQSSAIRLSTCHPALRDLFETVVQEIDCTVLEGHRGKEAQDAAFNAVPQRSKLPWPKGKHNRLPSLAVDVAPYPVDFGETGTPEQRRRAIERFYRFAHFVRGVALGKGIAIRYGGDWDGDWNFEEERFKDLVHFELVDPDPSPVVARPEEIA